MRGRRRKTEQFVAKPYHYNQSPLLIFQSPRALVCTENIIRVDAVMESPKLAE
jgi:hypothetical protein